MDLPIGGTQEFAGTYKRDGEKIFFSPGDMSGAMVLTLVDDVLTFNVPSFLQLGSKSTRRCTKPMSAERLTEDDAKRLLATSPLTRLFLGTYAVRPAGSTDTSRPEGSPTRIGDQTYRTYADWAKVGYLQVSPTKSDYCSVRSNRAGCDGLTEVKVEVGPKGKELVSTDGKTIEIPAGERKNLKIVEVRELTGLPEKRHLINVEFDYARSPATLQFLRVNDSNAAAEIPIKGRFVAHWNPKISQWELMGGDAVQRDKDYTTNVVDKFMK